MTTDASNPSPSSALLPNRRVFRAVVADQHGFVVDPWEAVQHLRGHDPEDSTCWECPGSASVRTGSALPSEPDEDGLNSRLPGSWQSVDLLVEHDGLDYEEAADAALLIEQVVVITNALNFYAASGHLTGGSTPETIKAASQNANTEQRGEPS